ncbi:MAG: plasmid mobilization protein [Alsobacter sp.]
MRALDLFSCAGGAGVGLARAGFMLMTRWTPQERVELGERAGAAGVSVAEYLRRAALFLVLVGCSSAVEVEPEPIECLPETVEIGLPEDAREDADACPAAVAGKPWEAVCGRSYMTEQKQVDGRFEWVCTRARDCDCLEEWADCTGDDVPIPGYCALQN